MRHVRNMKMKVCSTDTVSTAVAAKLLGMSAGTVIKLCENGLIAFHRRIILNPKQAERIISVSEVVRFAQSRGYNILPMYLEEANAS